MYLPFHLSKTILLVSILFSQFWAFATVPPENVEKAFKKIYPMALTAKWSVTKDQNKMYAVNFNFNKQKIKAYFDMAGNLIETEKEINAKELPEPVKKAIETQFQEFKILKSLLIEKNNVVSSYELVIKSEGTKTTLILSKDGYMIAR